MDIVKLFEFVFKLIAPTCSHDCFSAIIILWIFMCVQNAPDCKGTANMNPLVTDPGN